MRPLPDPGFAGDEGAADPALTAALAAYDADPDSGARWLAALAALQDARVLVPVVATADPGAEGDKLTDMSAVLMQGRSGRTALLAFTGLASLRAWDPAARPVPVTVPDAA
ncbi:MAG: SseB family protein, partial [Marmoricola sp.]|nr:SseB family protein [Marmoricola sp.]